MVLSGAHAPIPFAIGLALVGCSTELASAASVETAARMQTAPRLLKQNSVLGLGRLARRRPDHPPRAPGPSKSKATKAKAGVLPFIAPYVVTIPGATFSIDTKGVSANADDRSVQFRVGGRYQNDFSTATTSPRVKGLLPSTNDSRRAYFESYLTLGNGLDVAFQYDFANAMQPIQDAALAYRQPGTRVLYSVGNFKEPFSLNELMSDNVTTFTERSLMDSLTPARNFGGTIGTYGDDWSLTGGVFGGNANLGIDDGGIAGTVRATYAPIMEKGQVLHFGVAGSYRSLDPNGLALSISSRPEDYLERALVSTGTLVRADAVKRANVEALYELGRYRIQGEYTYVNVSGPIGQADRSFQGGYIEGAWVVNGEGRAYRIPTTYGADFAVLQGVQVADNQRLSNGGIGVFELAFRYSALDLQARDVRGGAEQDVTAGVGWYPDQNVRVLADYVHGWTDPAAFSVEGGRSVQSDSFVARLQVNW